MAKSIDPSLLSIAFTDRDLCTRSGTCVGVCPTEAISLDDNLYPVLNSDKCIECGLCAKTCPGGKVHYQNLTNLTFGPQKDNPTFDGHVKMTYVGYTEDEAIRDGGAGGGVVTGILWDLLKHGDVAGCLVTRMNPAEPSRGSSFIARTYEELLESQGSKYAVIPHNSILREAKEFNGPVAFAGLPCQIHGLRLAMAEDSALREKIAVVIGLFCGGALEPYVVEDMLQGRDVSKDEIRDFQFRGGDWPGRMRAVLKDGSKVDLHYADYKDGAYNYLAHLYAPMRCLTCIDGSSHFADISIGDVWTRDKQGEYRFKAHSRMLARTTLGVDILQRAVSRGTITATDVTKDPDYKTHRAQTKRKGMSAPLRIQRLKALGRAVPEYDRELGSNFTLQERLTEKAATALHFLSKQRAFRYPFMRFLLSKYSVPLIYARRLRKKLKYRG